MTHQHEKFDPARGRIQETLVDPSYKIPGHPQPREAKSQQAQLNSVHQHGTRKDVKVPFAKKIH